MDVELLEDRRFLSVTVSEGYPGFYQITGDDQDDSVAVSVNMTEGSFTLDGTTYTGAEHIVVDGGEGNDTVSLTTADGSGCIGAAIVAGSGDDNITLNFDGAIWAGDGNDIINISDSFQGEVYGEAGNDQMNVSSNCINAQILGGDGSDLIDCSNNNFGVIVSGGIGDDTIIGSNYDDQISGDEGNDSLIGGTGDDTFSATDSGDTIDGGEGFDVLYAGGSYNTASSIEQIF